MKIREASIFQQSCNQQASGRSQKVTSRAATKTHQAVLPMIKKEKESSITPSEANVIQTNLSAMPPFHSSTYPSPNISFSSLTAIKKEEDDAPPFNEATVIQAGIAATPFSPHPIPSALFYNKKRKQVKGNTSSDKASFKKLFQKHSQTEVKKCHTVLSRKDKKDRITQIVAEIEKTFSIHANTTLGAKQTSWMRGQAVFLGISTSDRRSLQKNIFKKYFSPVEVFSENEITDLITFLWEKSEREYHYIAIDIAKHFLDIYSPDMFPIFEKMIRSHSWWDTVDNTAPNLVGSLVSQYPHLLDSVDVWISDSNMWIRRSAIILQLKWKKATDIKRLTGYCITTMVEKEFFIQKAIGWALREYSKTNKTLVRQIIDQHRSSLSPLSIKEASKHL